MKIAVYAIAKNEAKFAARFATSCRQADLTVVLDTGCTDQTGAILTEHGVGVHSETVVPWRFDAARNRALELVPDDTEICIKLDLDECLSPGWREALESAWVPGRTTQAWYTYTWNWKRPGVPQQRFLQNHCHARHGFTWRHRCHEALYCTGKSNHVITVPAMHVGHHPDPEKSRAGYLPLIEEEHRADPSARSRFYLGREYYFCQRFPEAIALFQEYLELSYYPAERGVACWYLYMMTRENRWAYRAVAESPTRQYLLLAAQTALAERDYAAAFRWCMQAITAPRLLVFGEQAVDDPEILDTAAECAWRVGRPAEAFGYLERASQLDPRPQRIEKYVAWANAAAAVPVERPEHAEPALPRPLGPKGGDGSGKEVAEELAAVWELGRGDDPPPKIIPRLPGKHKAHVHHPIYRIWPGYVRSPRAVDSWRDFPLTDVPAVRPDSPQELRSRERACSQAHANALRLFLASEAQFCIVIEDDVILVNRDWLSYADFDYFQPFADLRDETPGGDLSIRQWTLPQWGTQAYLASRRFAEAYIPLLEIGGVADHVNLDAAIGLRVGSFASNGVVHDNSAVSMISEERRVADLELANSQRAAHYGPVNVQGKCVPWCAGARSFLPVSASRAAAVDDADFFETVAECAWQAGERAAAFGYLERASQLDPRLQRIEKYVAWAKAAAAAC